MKRENRRLLRLLFIHALQEIRRDRSLEPAFRLLKRAGKDRKTISARALFFLGDFEGAMAMAASGLKSHPDDVELCVLSMGSAIELNDWERAERHMNMIGEADVPESLERQLPFFRYAITKARHAEGPRTAIEQLDDLFSDMGCQPIRVSPVAGEKVFDSLVPIGGVASRCEIEDQPLSDGPLVSVIMTAFNVEHLIRTSVTSIVNQNYRNLELIVVDDCSTDGTVDVLRSLEKDHECLHVITKTTNDGTYVSKNLGILQAQGHYIAFQDSDDWSHPDRLGKSVAVLETQPTVYAITTEWVRMTTEGDFLVQAQNEYTYRSFISLVFRHKEVLSQAGFFDSVRAEADTEFIRRISKIFGDDRVLHCPWPLCFGRVRSGSITANPEFGQIRGCGRPAREEYRKAYRNWHERIRKGSTGYMSFPQTERPFKAPVMMLPNAGGQADDSRNSA